MIEIEANLTIPDEEITFGFSRSGGPGGQNVNKTSTRVTLRFHVLDSPSLTREQKRRITERLATRISKEGVLRIVARASRSQLANRDAALRRFVDLLRGALIQAPPRRPTKPHQAARERRLEHKHRHAQTKRLRREDGSRD